MALKYSVEHYGNNKCMNKEYNIAGFPVVKGACFLYNEFMAVGVSDKRRVVVKVKRINSDARLRKFPFIRALIFVIIAIKNAIFGYFLSQNMQKHKTRTTFYGWLVKSTKFLVGLIGLIVGLIFGNMLLVALPNFLTMNIYKACGFVVVRSMQYNLLNSSITAILFLATIFVLARLMNTEFFAYNAVNKTMNALYDKVSLDVKQVEKQSSRFFFNPFSIVILSLVIAIFVLPLFFEKNFVLNLIYKIVLFAIILSTVYEVFIFLRQYDSKFARVLMFPSFAVQALFPKNTNEKNILCAIVALKEVLMMNENDKINERHNLIYEWQKIRERFLKNGIVDESDVDWIFCEVLKCNRAELKSIKYIAPSDLEQVLDYAEQRLQGEPLQRIFGHANFYGFEFELNDDTLIPRFDTEILAECVIKEIKERARPLKVLDLCTGSGCIAITIAKLTNAQVIAIDINESALQMARINAEHLNAKVQFFKSDLFESLGEQKFDIIVSNPPYIKSSEIPTLEVADFDPHLALDGGADGLNFYRRIALEAPKYLTANGKIFLEIGKGQSKDVKKLLADDFVDITSRKDFAGITRVILATKKHIGERS